MKTTESKTTTQVQTKKEDNRPFFSQEGQDTGVFTSERPFFASGESSAGHFFNPSFGAGGLSKSTNSPQIQAKLSIGAPDDPYEREADAMAEKVVQRLAVQSSPDAPPATGDTLSSSSALPVNGVQRKCAECEQEEKIQEKEDLSATGEQLQRKPIFDSNAEPPDDPGLPPMDGGVQRKCASCGKEINEEMGGGIQRKSNGEMSASPDVATRLNASKGGGSPLAENTRTSMESAFGADFSGVRVHTGSEAVQMSRDLSAQAFTHGKDVYFGEGKYSPGTREGGRLLAHELTHVGQQGGESIQKKRDWGPYRYTYTKTDVPNIQNAWYNVSIPGTDYVFDPSISGIKNAVGIAADTAVDIGEGALDLGADALMAIVERISPELAELIRKGPKAVLHGIFGDSVQQWLKSLLGGLDISTMAGDIRAGLAEAFEVLKGVMSGDPKSCAAFEKGIDAIRNLISQFKDNPIIQALKGAFDMISGFVKKVSSLILTPVFDALKEIGGGIFDAITEFGKTIWGWGKSVKAYLGKAWDWVMEKLGITSDDIGGIWDWIKGIANDIWNEIKTTFAPILGPVKKILGIMLMFTPVGPFIVAIKYGPQIVESIKWLWANKDNPDIVKAAHEQMSHTILPQLLTSMQGFYQGFQAGVNEFVTTLTQLGTHVLELIGGITGVPILSMLQSLVQSISNGIQSLISWGQETLTKAVTWVQKKYQDFKQYIDPLVEVLSSLAVAAVNPAMIPVILAGWAWRALPDCYKPPIINFLLDAIIGILEALPSLPAFGLLWPLLKSTMIGLLKGFRERKPDDQIKVTNKLAKIISGASLSFIWGFVKGFLRGVWEGITDPFVLIFMAIEGLNNLMSWFNSLIFGEETSKAGNTASAAGQTVGNTESDNTPKTTENTKVGGPPPGLTERLGEMGAELEPPVNEVTGNFRPAVSEYFQSGEGMSFDQLMEKMGSAWTSIEGKIQQGAEGLSKSIIDFMLKDSAEEEMGDGVGWLSGTIAFEVLLAILTAGSYTAAKGVMKVLKFFAKILDWTGEVLGVVFKLLAKLGGYFIDIVKGLGKLISKATGPIKVVLDALGEIGEKLMRFADELFGKFAKETGGEAAEKAAKEVVGKETLEESTEQTMRGIADETNKKGIKTTAEETTEEITEKGGKIVGTEPLGNGAKLTFYEDGRFFICWNPCGKIKDRFAHMLDEDIMKHIDEIEIMLKSSGQKRIGQKEAKKLYQELYERESGFVWDMQLRLGSLSDEEAGILEELLNIRKQDLIPNNSTNGINSFEKWFDEISDEEFEILWKDSEIREMLESRIRWPGKEHEWLLASRADYFKRWGVSMSDIHKWRTSTSSTGGINPFWKHGGEGSTYAHNELIEIVENSTSFNDFKRQLNNWANYRLPNGIDDLPKELRLALKP